MNISFLQIIRFIIFQSILILILSFCFLFLQGVYAGLSAFLGGIIFLIPTILFFKIFLLWSKKYSPSKIVKTFYLAEFVKIIITILLFTVAMQWSNLVPIPLFVVFIVSQLTYFILPLM